MQSYINCGLHCYIFSSNKDFIAKKGSTNILAPGVESMAKGGVSSEIKKQI